MTDWRDQANRLHAAGYLQQFSNIAMNMCVPFWWSSGPQGGARVRQNGTLCYVDTGTRRIGITADHVYAGYLSDKDGYDEVECQFGGSTVNPEACLIARSEKYDLATFDVPEVFVSASFRNVYYHNALRWPPNPIQAREVALHGGYPQVLRNPRTNEVDFPFQWFATRVNDANNERISLLFLPVGCRLANGRPHEGRDPAHRIVLEFVGGKKRFQRRQEVIVRKAARLQDCDNQVELVEPV
jgi:hypothetical protein